MATLTARKFDTPYGADGALDKLGGLQASRMPALS